MTRHSLAHFEIEAVEISRAAPSRMSAQRCNRCFEFPTVQCAGDQSAQKCCNGMFVQRAAEIKTPGNSESIESAPEEGKISARLTECDADFAECRASLVKQEDAARDFAGLAFERAGSDESGRWFPRGAGQQAVFRPELEGELSDLISGRRIGQRQREIA